MKICVCFNTRNWPLLLFVIEKEWNLCVSSGSDETLSTEYRMWSFM